MATQGSEMLADESTLIKQIIHNCIKMSPNQIYGNEFAKSLKIQNYKEWRRFIKANRIPKNIPKTPNIVFKQEWISWPDFLGKKKI